MDYNVQGVPLSSEESVDDSLSLTASSASELSLPLLLSSSSELSAKKRLRSLRSDARDAPEVLPPTVGVNTVDAAPAPMPPRRKESEPKPGIVELLSDALLSDWCGEAEPMPFEGF